MGKETTQKAFPLQITLLSDSHSHLDDSILKLCSGSDEIWHAGDIGDLSVTDRLAEIAPVRAVYGNIDNHQIRAQWPRDVFFDCGGKRVWMTHIGGYPPNYRKAIREMLDQNPVDIFICGHSHICKVMRDTKRNLLHMNPGAIGLQGFHHVRTLLRFQIANGKLDNLEVAELAR